MAKRNAYETKIKPRLKEIEEWKRLGWTAKQIHTALGVSSATYYKYLVEKEEIKESVKKGEEQHLETRLEIAEEMSRTVELAKDMLAELVKEKNFLAIQYVLNNYGGAMTEYQKQSIQIKKLEIEKNAKRPNVTFDVESYVNAMKEIHESVNDDEDE